MLAQIITGLRMFLIFTLLTGVIYPLAVTGAAQVLFPRQANGSLVEIEGRVVGSELIGQGMEAPGYFWPRPSAIGYTPAPSSGSNLGATSRVLQEQVSQREQNLRAANPLVEGVSIPADLLFASGSGLDPHISVEAAQFQILRVSQERGLSESEVAALVEQFTERPQFGLLGQPRVNVLLLNLAVDGLESK